MNQFTPPRRGAGEEGCREEPQAETQRLSLPGHLLKGSEDRGSTEAGQAGISEALASEWTSGLVLGCLVPIIAAVGLLLELGSQSKRNGPLLT